MRQLAATALTPLEIASGLVLGTLPKQRAPGGGGAGDGAPTPRDALEHALLAPLQRPPCFVSFSGGRDSSAVLAVATLVARREGLPLPIPATLRLPAAPTSHESDWQEIVVEHLALPDWFRFEASSELDCVGPFASPSLARHGLLWPCNAHFHVPLLEQARGGSLLTGVGGDEMFGPSRWWYTRQLLNGQIRPRPRDTLAVGLALAPPRLRQVVIQRRIKLPPTPWLRPAALAEVERRLSAGQAAEPFGWGAAITWRSRYRYLAVAKANLAALATDADVAISHPLLDPAFVDALARIRRADRYSQRRQAMSDLFDDVLPPDVIARRTKAAFEGAFWHEYSRALVERWQGEGVDESLVDVERLAAEWQSDAPDPRTYTLLQSIKVALDTPQPASR